MDFRTFIAVLEKRGLIQTVEEPVDWKHQIGEISRTVPSALWFKNVKDYPGQSVFTGALGSSEAIELLFEIEGQKNRRRRELVKAIRQRARIPLAPVVVEDGPVTENICMGKHVNLFRFAVPWWSRVDGGRFIGTWHVNITKDPQTGSRNVGVYRMQIVDKRSATVSVSPKGHLAIHMREAEKRGKALKMAVAIGVSEFLVMAGGASFALGVDEYSMAGAWARKPLEIIRCRGVDLEVPAQSEIVLEGELKPGIRVKDGPYLDYAGIANSNPAAFLFEVNSVMYRNNPIFRGTAVGRPGAEDHHMLSLLAGAGLVDFHGSKMRRLLQNFFLKNRMYTLLQMSGRIGKLIK
ncbi:UbiD family decarboxylase [Chitinispirillales bacterium ANBcel5]|uniref:UbiD family decarboxylase domain-containing protein n=1 Tax=Cellulosispirillum alkaliphilum TaxID=3039283 RepID=UPI002A544561|nr:UbiD family decarboxylase [Chitinispirillales bacterium ANBcel5]